MTPRMLYHGGCWTVKIFPRIGFVFISEFDYKIKSIDFAALIESEEYYV